MTRPPEHEKLIDELAAKSGQPRHITEHFVDDVLRDLTKQLITRALKTLIDNMPEGGHIGGIASGPPYSQVLTNEYVVPHRQAARLTARNIRKSARD